MLFSIDGMWCGSCARAVEVAIGKVPGVTQAGVHFATTSALVRWDPDRCDLHELERRVRALGYRLASPLPPDETEKRLDAEARAIAIRIAIAVFFGMWSMVAAIILYLDQALAAGPDGWWVAIASGLLASPAIVYAGLPFYRVGWRTAKVGAPGTDSIISMGVVGAVALSVWHLTRGSSDVYFDTATMLVALLLVGRLIEIAARRRALVAIRALEGVIPQRATRMTPEGDAETVAVGELALGDVVRVDAGSIFPADGIVVGGRSAADRSALTGESRPVPLHLGDAVHAATVNLVRRVTVQVTREQGDWEINRIGGHVASAIGGRGETQRLADQLARLLSISIPLIAVATAVVLVIAGFAVGDALLRSLTVLVIACPCALGLATPVAFTAAATKAARMGLLLRDPAAFERLGSVKTVIFDKTGTLSEGKLRVASVKPAEGWDEQTVLAAAAQAEKGIDHPIARAISAVYGNADGDGGERDGRRAIHIDQAGREILVDAASVAEDETATCLRVAIDGSPIGTIRLTDQPREEAAAALRALRSRGRSILLATGDSIGPARTLADLVGIRPREIRAGCTPSDKLLLVSGSPGPILFVGDGINDGPALAAADCGMAIQEAHAGATALASVVISRGGIMSVVGAVDLARKTRSIMRENLGFAIIYNAVAVVLAITGSIGPVVAAVAMLLSSLSVTSNSLRLLR